MEFETIMQLVTILVTLVLGIFSKRSKFILNNLIPLQNIVIGLIMAIVTWFITKNFSLAVSLSGLCAGGTYDFIKNLIELKKPQAVVADDPVVYEEIPAEEEPIEEVVEDGSNE